MLRALELAQHVVPAHVLALTEQDTVLELTSRLILTTVLHGQNGASRGRVLIVEWGALDERLNTRGAARGYKKERRT